MNLRSGRGTTSAGADPGNNSHGEGIGNNNGESHEAPLLAPPPPLPPLMTHAEMMVEMLAARRESARAMELLAQAIGGFACGGHRGNGGNGGGARGLERPVPIRTFWGHTRPRSCRLLSI